MAVRKNLAAPGKVQKPCFCTLHFCAEQGAKYKGNLNHALTLTVNHSECVKSVNTLLLYNE